MIIISKIASIVVSFILGITISRLPIENSTKYLLIFLIILDLFIVTYSTYLIK